MQSITEKLEDLLGTKKAPSEKEKELFRRAQDFVEYIKWIPGLRMVAVSNSLAMYATHENSDIDLFIITEAKRLWLVRTLVLIIATILRVRTSPGDEAGKFCFPFFITEKKLSLKEIAIKNTPLETSQKRSNLDEEGASEGTVRNQYGKQGAEGGIQKTSFSEVSDVYLAYWIISLKPIYNQYYTYGRFMEVNQSFCENTLSLQPTEEERTNLLRENRIFLTLTQRHDQLRKLGSIFSPILTLKNSILGWFSKKYISRKIPSEGTEGIVIDDDILKLHYNDNRRVTRDRVLDISE